MKARFIIFALFISFPYFSFSQDSVRFRDVSLTEGLKMAQAEHKPVFFMCYASWCQHCKRMKEVIFHDSAVADFYNKHFICLKQDMEQGEGIALHKKFQVKEYPTFVFLDGDGTTLYQCVREKNDSMMIAEGKTALTPAKQYPYLKQQFEKDITNADNCYAYIFALRSAMLDCSAPAKEYLATQSDQQLLSAINWKIIANGVRDINSREIQFVLSHQKEFEAIASPLRVERKLVNLAEELLSPYVNAKDSAGYFALRPQAVFMHYNKVDSLIFKYDLLMYEESGNWNGYRRTADKSAEKLAWSNASQLKEIAANYASHATDVSSLLLAVKWEKHALALNDEYAPYIVCAKLYQKAGDRKSAMEMAEKGRAFALKYGFSHFDADALLNELKK